MLILCINKSFYAGNPQVQLLELIFMKFMSASENIKILILSSIYVLYDSFDFISCFRAINFFVIFCDKSFRTKKEILSVE